MANIDAGLVRGPQGPQGVKGDPFTYADFTKSQIAELQRPATEAATRADKATEDAKAAIADVKATEAKLYPVAENVLKGKVKETFVHVDDAFLSSLLGIEIEGACRQDGTPSPDSPVPIEVIEHPVVQVRGRNLLNTEPLNDENNFDTSQSGAGFWVYEFVAPSTGDYTVSVKQISHNANYLMVSDNPKFNVGKQTWFSHKNAVSGATSASFKNVNAVYLYFSAGISYIQDVLEKVGGIQIEKGLTATALEPYTSQSLAFTLPTEHPYLAKLPDGTADEIVVDKNGNVELVARVGKLDTSNIRTTEYITALANGLTRYEYRGFVIPPAAIPSFTITPNFVPIVDFMFSLEGCYTAGKTLFVGTTSDPTETIRASGYLYYKLATSVVYTLGKIEMPKAQDSITNVWTDAEVTPRTGIEYTRDVNIVVANLESAIASITQG